MGPLNMLAFSLAYPLWDQFLIVPSFVYLSLDSESLEQKHLEVHPPPGSALCLELNS